MLPIEGGAYCVCRVHNMQLERAYCVWSILWLYSASVCGVFFFFCHFPIRCSEPGVVLIVSIPSSRLGMSVTTQGGSGRQCVTGPGRNIPKYRLVLLNVYSFWET